MLSLRPVTLSDAKKYVGNWHRHSLPPQGGLCAVGVEVDGKLVGVAVVGRPMARALQDGFTCEITRNATDGTRNACSKLYGAACRAAYALGYHRIYTYTLQSESGNSLRASGFVVDAQLRPRESWSSPSRNRVQRDLYGVEKRSPAAKIRWIHKSSARIKHFIRS
jgi:hypothetical protein